MTPPLRKSKSRTSLLVDLIANDERGDRGLSETSQVDLEGLVSGAGGTRQSPKMMLKELLGEFFVDADSLEKKELIGEGGFAVVHRCLYFDANQNRTISVAKKELKPDLLESIDDLREFVMEASLQRKLHHRNIVKILGIGASDCTSLQTTKRSMFILQEFIPGKSLKEMVIQQMCRREKRVYSMKQAIGWLVDIASALHYLHDVCRPMIIHRDLKLENILLTGNTHHAKLCDFGLHKRLKTQVFSSSNLTEVMDESYYGGSLYQTLMDRVSDGEPSLGGSGEQSLLGSSLQEPSTSEAGGLMVTQSVKPMRQVGSAIDLKKSSAAEVYFSDRPDRKNSFMGFTGKVGSIVYMAPEVFLGKQYNEKVDVFSFGVIMYELLSQKNLAVKYGLLNEPGTLNGYAEKVAKGFRETIPQHWPDFIKCLISDCWNEDPASRPSFKDIINKLNIIVASGISERMESSRSNPGFCCCM
eukprot:g4001.t1